ncbi:ABC transporter permease [Sulfuricella sp.]|uniref:ABC transporter permease n=1 Tax=Sulfuricella sp. TaxID=2099377 RepID=UPI002C9D2F67|nr:ABC transporter permease [Sulfuricella sp.]HUX63983.1 ABC transporter permease [Sulfuricella sp.]
MLFKPVLLWTDMLLWLLLAGVAFYAWRVRQREHLLQPWRRLLRSRSGVASAVVLLAFVAVGVLDSLHFRLSLEKQGNGAETHYSPEVLSVFDLMVGPLRKQVEKTYSAPFAAQLYTKETIELPGGKQVRDYPRLKFGGAHLREPAQEQAGDVAATALQGSVYALVLCGGLATVLALWLARRRSISPGAAWTMIRQGRDEIPWRTFLATIGLLVLFVCLSMVFSAKYHIFGTDKVGQDVFYLALKSIRTGLMIGTLTTLVMLPFALLLGIMAGYFRGWVDDVIQYTYTTLSSIPGVLLIAAAVLILQVYMDSNQELFDTVAARADIRLLFLCVILGITSWTGLCRLLRGETLKVREMEFIQAATAFGVGHFRIIARHILPNVMHIVLISIVLDFSALVLAEAVLSYVGVGVDPAMQSWGNMINGARLEMAREPMVWWSLLAAFVFMFVLVLSANLFSDRVRDAFDPRVR